MAQLISRSLQQQPPPHGRRSFFDQGPEQPMELRSALVRLTRQILRLRLSVQGIGYDRREAVARVLTIHFIHAAGSSPGANHRQKEEPPPDRAYQSSTLK